MHSDKIVKRELLIGCRTDINMHHIMILRFGMRVYMQICDTIIMNQCALGHDNGGDSFYN